MTCPACNAPVLKVVSSNLKKPSVYYVDAKPDPIKGRVFLTAADTPLGTRLAIPVSWIAHKRGELEEMGIRLYRVHYLTCPVAQERRAKAAA